MKKFISLILLLSLSFVLTSLKNRNSSYIVYPTEEKIIYDIVYSENGKALIVADGKNLKWFSTENQHMLGNFSGGHENTILTMHLSKDSTLLVSGGKDSTIVVWDVLKKEKIKHLTYHKGIVSSVYLSPDNRYLYSGGTDNLVFIYDLKSEKLVSTFSDHTDDVTSIDVSEDGKWLISASADGAIKLYDIESKIKVATIGDRKSWVREVSFNRNGDEILSCGDNGKVIRWTITDINNIKKIDTRQIYLNRIHSVDIFSDNQTYVTGGLNGVITIVTKVDDYKSKINAPIHKVLFKPGEGSSFVVAMATRGEGVLQMESKNMKFKVR